MSESEQLRGYPREQYERTYILLPPTADSAWAKAVIDATWNSRRHTIGGSSDDAGIGNLDVRRVIAVNPAAHGSWGGGDLLDWFKHYYPGVEVIPVVASTPEILKKKLVDVCGIPTAEPSPKPPKPVGGHPIIGLHDLEGGRWMLNNGVKGWCTEAVYLGTHARELPELKDFKDSGVNIVVNLRYSWARRDRGAGTLPPPNERDGFVNACLETIKYNRRYGVWGWVIGNEGNAPSEWPEGYSLTPEYCADVFNLVWSYSTENDRIAPMPVDPFNPGWGDWRTSWRRYISSLDGADFFALHAYDHGINARWDEEFRNAPLLGVHYNLPVIEDQIAVLPATMRDRPIVVTETNHGADGSSWGNGSAQWVKNRAIQYLSSVKNVVGVCLYRYNYDDRQYRVRDYGAVTDVVKELGAR